VTWDRALSQIMFQAGNVILVTSLMDEAFPDYTQAIPTAFDTTFTLNRRDLVRMLRAFKLISQDGCVKLSYHTSGVVKFEAKSEELGDVDNALQTSVSGNAGEMLLNVHLLTDVIENVCASSLLFELSGPVEPLVIVPTGRNDCVSVLMPMVRRDSETYLTDRKDPFDGNTTCL
jgi:DNA polymerase III sliding clamp (beta) subunit (PCNA family)